MRITKDTTVEELLHGEELAYIDLDEGELCHWKYVKKKKLPNGKWRYYYDYAEAYPVIEKQLKVVADSAKKNRDTRKKISDTINKIDRYAMAGERWFHNPALYIPIADLYSGRTKPLSWESAKKEVDNLYKLGDPDKLLTEEYKKWSKERAKSENLYWDKKQKLWITRSPKK